MPTPVQKLREEPAVYRVIGDVISVDDNGRYEIDIEGMTYIAKRAFSCMIQPELHDQVLLEGDRDSGMYITAILQRSSDTVPTIDLPSGLNIEAQGSRLRLTSEEGIELSTHQTMRMDAQRLVLRSDEGDVLIKRLSLLGKQLIGQMDKVNVLGKIISVLSDRILQKSKTSHRVVEELDSTRSRHIDYQASHNLQLHGENTLMTADKLVKMDGDQIHLG